MPEARSISALEVGSAISLLGLLIFAAHEEIMAAASALEQFLASAPVALW
ncbi:hypothetical protein FHT78_002061 [Rhizobium sp. BK196]|nr:MULTISPECIES: hypothetical protein [unclassified Rhizobium]MBB3310318.1 hypothetical protein [Rhizobium sp. BK196]MBB3464906.1 hypothetical protein [Rhizobium sp. BK377]